ncbi:PAS domain S-box protein [Cyanobium sp. FGCU-52]|nr:PAS domain S-box protein [Cyanobium sp. FGCU52]
MASSQSPEPETLSDQGLLQQAMRHAAIGMALVTAEGRFLEANPALCRLLGRDDAELQGLSLQDVTHPDDLAETEQLVAEIVNGRREAFQREVRCLHADGELIWGQVSMSCLRRGAECLVLVQIVDISEGVSQRQALADQDHHYRLLADNVLDVVWTIDLEGRFTYLSPSVQGLRGFTPEEAMAQPLEQIHPPESLERFHRFFHELLEDTAAGRPAPSFRGELDYFRRDGSTIWAEVIVLPVIDSQGRLEKLLGVSRDISERKDFEQQLLKANQQVEQLAITDWLTGLWNRGHLESQIQQAIARSERYREPLSLILCDLDHFKTINDRFGHVRGDEVLREFCHRIRKQLRRSDGFGRWGGEEFLLLLPCSDAAAAATLAHKLQKAISATPFDPVGSVTCSFGVAERRSGETEDSWLLRVNKQLDAAKARGRNHVVVA